MSDVEAVRAFLPLRVVIEDNSAAAFVPAMQHFDSGEALEAIDEKFGSVKHIVADGTGGWYVHFTVEGNEEEFRTRELTLAASMAVVGSLSSFEQDRLQVFIQGARVRLMDLFTARAPQPFKGRLHVPPRQTRALLTAVATELSEVREARVVATEAGQPGQARQFHGVARAASRVADLPSGCLAPVNGDFDVDVQETGRLLNDLVQALNVARHTWLLQMEHMQTEIVRSTIAMRQAKALTLTAADEELSTRPFNFALAGEPPGWKLGNAYDWAIVKQICGVQPKTVEVYFSLASAGHGANAPTEPPAAAVPENAVARTDHVDRQCFWSATRGDSEWVHPSTCRAPGGTALLWLIRLAPTIDGAAALPRASFRLIFF